MSEVPAPTAEDLATPGNIITFADMAELVAFEDLIAGEVSPVFRPEQWATRNALNDLIRPPKFNGRITDITLTVMDEPYERLVDATERGWKFGKAGGMGGKFAALSADASKENIPLYRGFQLLANAQSTGRGIVGQIQTELWYYPLTPDVVKGGTVTVQHRKLRSGEDVTYTSTSQSDRTHIPTIDGTGRTVNRVVAKPRIESPQFIEFQAKSKRIGFNVLRTAMTHPLSVPVERSR